MQAIIHLLEDLPSRRWHALTLVLWGGAIAAPFGPPPSLPWLGAILVIAGFLWGAGFEARRRLKTLPLQLSPRACTYELGGRTAYAFRVRLGRGRLMDRANARITWAGPDGEVELTPLLAEGERLVGPWTLVVVDQQQQCEGEGVFRVEVRATAEGLTWAIAREWSGDAITSGRFIAPLVKNHRAWTWRTTDWDALVPQDLS